ncbi:MAG: hypothetical protein WD737_05785 [Gemmatimonadota bacterium]
MTKVQYQGGAGAFELTLPDGWFLEQDEEEGALVTSETAHGFLHLVEFARGPEDATDPAEELYAFLEEQEIQLEEDEVEDLPLGETGELALCEYLADEEDEATYWMIAVATTPGRLLFANYSCAAGDEEGERELIRTILSTLTFAAPAE